MNPMTTAATTAAGGGPHGVSTARLRPYLLRAKYECVQMLRQPSFAIPTLVFPTMFYLFFGVLFAREGVSTYLLATYGTFGIMGPALFGFGVGVALERESGSLRLERVTPMPPMAYLGAKVSMSLLFGALVIVELFLIGAWLGDVRLERAQWFGLAGVLVLSILPFAAIGLALGVRLKGQGAPAVINLIYLPMSILSGLWIPIMLFPDVMKTLALALPPYHVAQLALGVLDMDEGQGAPFHLGVLAAYTAVCLALAIRGFRNLED